MSGCRKILVFGVSGGIGCAVRSEALRRGWECVGTSRKDGVGDFVVDFSDATGLEAMLMRLFVAEGPFDAMVYCVGECPIVPVSGIDPVALASCQMVNCNGFILAVKAFSRPGAHVKDCAVAVAVSSVSAREGWAGGVAYCASKGALSAAGRALAAELAPKGIRVETIEPGHVLTDMFRNGAGRMGTPESAARSPDDVASELMDFLESKRKVKS